MVYDSAGVLRADDGSELGRADALPAPAFGRVIVGSESYAIEKASALGWHFQLLGGDGGLVYDFKPGLRKGGTVRSAGGEEAAEILKALIGTHWTITPAGSAPIEVTRREGHFGPILSDDGHLIAPDLDLSGPNLAGVGQGPTPLLVFCCWLIAEWDS